MQVPQSALNWQPDPHLPSGKGATLQEFVCHTANEGLRIILHQDGHSEVEINDSLIGRTDGFDNAAALAELYINRSNLILADASGLLCAKIAANSSGFALVRGNTPRELLKESGKAQLIRQSTALVELLDTAEEVMHSGLQPAFLDQREINVNVSPGTKSGLIVAAHVTRHALTFTQTVSDHGAMLFSYRLARSPEGTLYSIYRLATGGYLAEGRSRHDAFTIGEFTTPEAATAYCTLVNAARYASEPVVLDHEVAPGSFQTRIGQIKAERSQTGRIRLSNSSGIALGEFPSIKLAEAFATVLREAHG